MVSLNSNLYLWRITIYGSVFLWKDQMTWFLKKHSTEHKPTDLSVTRGAVLIPRTQHSLHSIKLSWLIRGQLKNCMKNCTKCIAINWVFEFTWVDSKYRFLFGLSTVWLLPYCSIWFVFSSFSDREGVYVEIISKDLNKWKVKVKLKTSAPDRQ